MLTVWQQAAGMADKKPARLLRVCVHARGYRAAASVGTRALLPGSRAHTNTDRATETSAARQHLTCHSAERPHISRLPPPPFPSFGSLLIKNPICTACATICGGVPAAVLKNGRRLLEDYGFERNGQ